MQKKEVMQEDSKKSEKIKYALPITEEEAKRMTEDLIVQGYCEYTFHVSKIPVVIKSLTWKEQKEFVKELSSIKEVEEDGRKISVAEYTGKTTDISIKHHLLTINGKSCTEALTSEAMVSIIATKIANLRTLTEQLLSTENLN